MKSRRELVFAIGLLGVFLVVYTWAVWQFFTRPIPGGNDFLTHYGAWQAYVSEGVSPYSEQAALRTQVAIYGRAALPGEDQNRMVYPFYSILIHGPFALIEDYTLARAIYMTLSQVALGVGVLLCLRLFRWQLSAPMLAFVLVWAFFYYPDARGILIGQFAILAFAAFAATLVLLVRKQDAWAGAILVFTTIKPTLVFLVVPFLLLWSVTQRRWKFAIGFLATWSILMVASFFILPSWFGDWVYRVTLYSGYTYNFSPVWTIGSLGPVTTLIYLTALIVLLLRSWRRGLSAAENNELFWTVGLTLIVSNLISPRAATTDYVLMLMPTLGLFAAVDRAQRWGRPAVIALMLGSLIGLWVLHIVTVQGDTEQAIMFLPWPLALGFGWVAGRNWLLITFPNSTMIKLEAHA